MAEEKEKENGSKQWLLSPQRQPEAARHRTGVQQTKDARQEEDEDTKRKDGLGRKTHGQRQA